jgi:hypothetical protein
LDFSLFIVGCLFSGFLPTWWGKHVAAALRIDVASHDVTGVGIEEVDTVLTHEWTILWSHVSSDRWVN